MTKVSELDAATPTGTDWVHFVDDPAGTPLSKRAPVSSLADATNGATVYRIWDGMSEAINTVWQAFWAETAKAVLIIEPKASGVYTLDGTAVSCTSTAATAEKYVFGNNQEVYTATGSLLWRGAVGATSTRKLFLHDFFYSAPGGDIDSTGAGLVIQNPNWNVLDIRTKYTKIVVGTHTATGQCEFNWMNFDMSNCDNESSLWFVALSSGNGSMRGNQIHARIFMESGAGLSNAWRCSMNLYHSNVEIHTGGFGGTGGAPSTDPTSAGYTGADAVFWIENDGSVDNSFHGAYLRLREEKGSGTGKVGLWVEDNGSARKQEHGHIDFASTYAYDYMAVADFAHPSELPRFTFGINQQTQVNAWTADDGSWIVPVMRWDGGRYNITDVPGVYGDGVTDVDALIAAALSNGGSWYFPPGNYHLSAGVNITHTDHLDVECADGVLFSTNGEAIDDDLFDFDTANTGNTDGPLRFRWSGGIVDMSGVYNATGTSLNRREIGLLRQGTAATTDAFSFRNGYWSDLHLEGVHFYTKTNSWEEDPSSAALQHWMGDYTNAYISGGDSAIYINSGPGTVTIRDCVFSGTRDSAIYIAATGDSGGGGVGTTAPSSVLIDGCKMYWCSEGISLKGNGSLPAVVSNCIAYGTAYAYVCDHQASDSRDGYDNVHFVNCVADIYERAFQIIESEQCVLSNCRALRGGYLDWGSSARGTYGRVTLTGGASGSVNSIVITGVNGGSNILSSSVSYTTDLDTTAAAVAANINAGFGTHGVRANSLAGGIIDIFTCADGAELNGNSVTSSATTITTSDTAMAYMFPDNYAFEVEGSADTVIDSPFIAGTTAAFAANPDSRTVEGFLIHGLAAAASSTGGNIDATDTTIRNVYIDGVSAFGGDVTVTGPGDPLRTRIIGITIGADGVTTSTPVLLDSSSFVDWQEVRMAHRAEGSTQAIDTTTMEDIVGLTVGVVAGASYLLDGYIIYDANSADDMRFTWSITGTETDSYSTIMGPANTATGNSGIVNYLASATNTQTQIGGIDQVDASDIIGAPITGVVTAVSDGTCTLQARLGVDSSASDGRIYDGSWIRLTRVA